MKPALIFFFFLVQKCFAQDLNTDVLDQIKQKNKLNRSDALIIYHNEELILKELTPEGTLPIESMSITKSIVSLGIGKLYDTGSLKISDSVSKYFPEWNSSQKEKVTIHHLLTHSSGIAGPSRGRSIYLQKSCVKDALNASLAFEPGSQFSYSNRGTNLLMGIIGNISSGPQLEFFKENFFDPMQINDFDWKKDSEENIYGFAGLKIKAEDLAKIGILLIKEGVLNDKQLLSKEWINEMFSEKITDTKTGKKYGLLWWVKSNSPGCYYAYGDYGQYLIVIPEKQIVAVRMITKTSTKKGSTDFKELPELLIKLAK